MVNLGLKADRCTLQTARSSVRRTSERSRICMLSVGVSSLCKPVSHVHSTTQHDAIQHPEHAQDLSHLISPYLSKF